MRSTTTGATSAVAASRVLSDDVIKGTLEAEATSVVAASRVFTNDVVVGRLEHEALCAVLYDDVQVITAGGVIAFEHGPIERTGAVSDNGRYVSLTSSPSRSGRELSRL